MTGLARARAAVLLAAACLACAGERLPLPPEPDLSAVEGPVRVVIEDARQRVVEQPDSGPEWGRLGMALHAHGLETEALTCYARAGELDPLEVRWPYLSGHALLATDPAASLGQLERAMSLAPTVAAVRAAVADALLGAGRDAEARKRYEEALRLDTKHRRALLGLAELMLREGDLPRAEKLLRQAEQLESRDGDVHQKLARLHRMQGEAEKAEREALLVRAHPQAAPAWDPYLSEVGELGVSSTLRIQRAQALFAAGRPGDAEREFRAAMEQAPDLWQARMNLGAVLAHLGRVDEALIHLREAVAMAPQDAEARANLGLALAMAGWTPEAIAELERALELDPTNTNARFNLGTALQASGDLDRAEAELRRAIGEDPSSALVHGALGDVLAQRGSGEEALRHWRQAVELGGARPDVHVRVALAAARLGRFDECTRVLRAGLRQYPRDADLLSALVTVLATAPVAQARDGEAAVQLAVRLVGIRGQQHLPSLDLLAAAHAEAGRFDRAVAVAEGAAGIARRAGDERAVELFNARLALYRSGKPAHQ